MYNSFGNIFRYTTYGESHGESIGAVIDGCPAGLEIDMDYIQALLDKRKPGQSSITTERKESDICIISSGVFEGKTTGAPIHISIQNTNQKSKDYDSLKDIYRPSHADYVYEKKYGIRDHRGGGRSSARETAARVAVGAIAFLFLKKYAIEINGFVSKIGKIKLDKSYQELDLDQTYNSIVRCPDSKTAQSFIELIEQVKSEGDSVGGIISCVIKNAPVGLGEPIYQKLQSNLAAAMMSINAVKGFEYGSGFGGTELKGSEHNDAFENIDDRIATKTNHSGGIQGGITNGMDITFNVAFKPTSSISQYQNTIDKEQNNIKVRIEGRHDPCVLPRAVPVVEAMAAIVMMDAVLMARNSKI
jgi:chorismate synthase